MLDVDSPEAVAYASERKYVRSLIVSMPGLAKARALSPRFRKSSIVSTRNDARDVAEFRQARLLFHRSRHADASGSAGMDSRPQLRLRLSPGVGPIKREARHLTKSHAVDVHVCTRIRERRTLLAMSRTKQRRRCHLRTEIEWVALRNMERVYGTLA
jgi:hypothetical protein